MGLFQTLLPNTLRLLGPGQTAPILVCEGVGGPHPGPRVEAGGHCSPSPLLWGFPTSAMGLEADPLLLLLLEAGCVPPVKQNRSCPPTPWS